MNRVFDYLRLALKGRTKTLGQRLRASQLSYRMRRPTESSSPLLPHLNTTVAFSDSGDALAHSRWPYNSPVCVYSTLRPEMFT